MNSTFIQKKREHAFGLSELANVIAKPARYNSCPDSAQLSLDSRPGKTERDRERAIQPPLKNESKQLLRFLDGNIINEGGQMFLLL